MSKSINIANGQGFWGDSVDAPYSLIRNSSIDYLTLDYLAEVTMAIMQKQKNRNPEMGFATDFVDFVNNPESIDYKRLRMLASKHDMMMLILETYQKVLNRFI